MDHKQFIIGVTSDDQIFHGSDNKKEERLRFCSRRMQSTIITYGLCVWSREHTRKTPWYLCFYSVVGLEQLNTCCVDRFVLDPGVGFVRGRALVAVDDYDNAAVLPSFAMVDDDGAISDDCARSHFS